MHNLAVNVLDPDSLITAFGLIGILAVIFAETGLLIGVVLPGDSLLFLAGVFASGALAGHHVHLPLSTLLIATPVVAIAGAQTGYLLGARVGPRLFNRPESRVFKREYVAKAEYYLTRFGAGRAVVLARFIPIVRTFLNPVAGMVGMPRRTFTLWNVVGGILWTDGVILLGYWLGDSIASSIDRYLLPGVALVVALSLTPIAVEIVRSRRRGPVSGPDDAAGSGHTSAAPGATDADRR